MLTYAVASANKRQQRSSGSRMLTYAHVCSRMLTHADVCGRECQQKAVLTMLSITSALRQTDELCCLLLASATAYVRIHQHTSECVSIRQHTSAYVIIRQHTSRMLTYAHVCSRMADVCSRMLMYAHVCSRMLTYASQGVGNAVWQ
jgi:hypothetical protein